MRVKPPSRGREGGGGLGPDRPDASRSAASYFWVTAASQRDACCAVASSAALLIYMPGRSTFLTQLPGGTISATALGKPPRQPRVVPRAS